jgi:hypothetical protein
MFIISSEDGTSNLNGSARFRGEVLRSHAQLTRTRYNSVVPQNWREMISHSFHVIICAVNVTRCSLLCSEGARWMLFVGGCDGLKSTARFEFVRTITMYSTYHCTQFIFQFPLDAHGGELHQYKSTGVPHSLTDSS